MPLIMQCFEKMVSVENQKASGNIPSLDGNEPHTYHTNQGYDIDPAISMENCATATQKLHNGNDAPYIQARKIHYSRQEYVQSDMSSNHSSKHSIERGILETTAISGNKSNNRKLTRIPNTPNNLQVNPRMNMKTKGSHA